MSEQHPTQGERNAWWAKNIREDLERRIQAAKLLEAVKKERFPSAKEVTEERFGEAVPVDYEETGDTAPSLPGLAPEGGIPARRF